MTLDEEDRRLLKMKRAMEEIYPSEGWKVYAELVENQIKEREKVILTHEIDSGAESPVVTLLRLERVKGAIMGLRLALDNPRLIIEHGQSVLAAQRTGERSEEE